MSVSIDDFEQFFFELHGHHPFPWQGRLARKACGGDWPKVLDVPTGSGKTACIDIALFALAVRGSEAARRIFFIVDRRVIVSEAYERAGRIELALKRATGGVLSTVAASLCQLAGGGSPLETYELRGGAFRDENWVETPLQPAVIASTVDQIGSRLLFRGYGVSEYSWPIHAGLIANDALLFLDEAHCSKAFATTLESIEKYRGVNWASKPLGRPFNFVEMTATPARTVAEADRFTIDSADRADGVLRRRLLAAKPTRLLEPVKCKKDELSKFADALIGQAILLAEADAKRIAIMVNRVGTAKKVHERLRKAGHKSLLAIGRMRPLDRESIAEQWRPLKSDAQRDNAAERQFVVSTQCLEVGADLDFDILVTECASIDAVQQRFGRLDRTGAFGKARAAIAAASWQLTGKDGDPVYGRALQKTWDTLQDWFPDGIAQMGIESPNGSQQTVVQRLNALDFDKRAELSLQTPDAPVLLPAHLDALVQTSPRPEPEPLVEYFLHGPENGRPEVYVIWRGDLGNDSDRWPEIVRLCPPSSAEAMPVPLWSFRRWLAGEPSGDESDTETAARAEEKEATGNGRGNVLIWRGAEHCEITADSRRITPGSTVIVPASYEGWDDLGSRPQGLRADRGDEARFSLRRRFCVRLHPSLISEWDEPEDNKSALINLVRDTESDGDQVWGAFIQSSEYRKYAEHLERGGLSPYPIGPGWYIDGYAGEKKKRRKKEVLLRDHLKDVEAAVPSVAGDLISPTLRQALKVGARYHDYGKADRRYQVWLRNGDEMAARYAPQPLAKSRTATARTQAECGLPEDFRHEVLSLVFAAKAADVPRDLRDLVLHFIASHHGRCRPFAPLVVDEGVECVVFNGESVCRQELIETWPYSLASGISDRFWRFTRQYGWWGLAYLESMLRLADWKASGDEAAEVYE